MTVFQTTTCYQGDTLSLDFLLLDEGGAPEDLSNMTLRWAMSSRDEISVPILEKSESSGIVIVGPTEGRCRVTISAGDLSEAGTYLHEIEGTNESGATYTYGQGLLIVKPTIYPS